VQTLIEKSKSGDGVAFAELTRRYQNMAFACALSRLGDFHLAEDAVQEAFIAAYFCLHNLADTAAFPGWLRGIVHHQCSRIMRSEPKSVSPLEYAETIPAAGGDPIRHVEQAETRDAVMDAVMALPDDQREVVVLHYIHEYTHREIAEFIDIPIASVNNRLHAARTRLKRRMTGMVTHTLKERKLKNDFAKRIGEIVKVRGPIIDVRVESEDLIEVLDSLTVLDSGKTTVFSVAQRLGGGMFRCVAIGPKDTQAEWPQGFKSGAELVKAESDFMNEVSEQDLARCVAVLAPPRAGQPEPIETGIKVVDLFCPLVKGGSTGIFGLAGVGKAIMLGEIIRRIAAHPDGNTIFGLGRRAERPLGQESIKEDTEIFGLSDKTGSVEALHLITDLASNPDYAAVTDVFDSVIYCSIELAVQNIWPAIDPLIAHSKALTPEIVGAEHCEVARNCRDLIAKAREIMTDPMFLRYLAHGSTKLAVRRAIEHREEIVTRLSGKDRIVVSRARKLELFMGQPLFVTEAFTKRPGTNVPLANTIAACKGILSGRYDHLSEDAFTNIGDLAEAK